MEAAQTKTIDITFGHIIIKQILQNPPYSVILLSEERTDTRKDASK